MYKVAILGTRGIPNEYGGFEQFATFFSTFLASKEVEVFVYNSSLHSYQENTYKNVQIIHCKDFENTIGTAGQFLYDLNCILDARKRNFDVILQLGYTSSAIWNWLLPSKTKVITNLDGLEWKRSKFNFLVQRFLQYSEKIVVQNSTYLVADSLGIQSYIKSKYNKEAIYIPYGAKVFKSPDETILEKYGVQKENYDLVIARLEPENNVEIICSAFITSQSKKSLLIVGNTNTKYGYYLKEKFKENPQIKFLGSIFDQNELNNLRYFSHCYFHGHSVGGTNPSLLEAMSSNSLIIAHNNIFNESILNSDSFYFKNEEELISLIQSISKKSDYQNFIENNSKKIEQVYSFENVHNAYYNLILQCF